MKNITSKDPRKPIIVAALKRKSGGTKVTLLKQISETEFQGRCFKPEIVKDTQFTIKTGKYVVLGNFTVTVPEDFWQAKEFKILKI